MSIASPDIYESITDAQWAQIRAAWPDGARLETAWRLALDVDTLAALLADKHVNPDRIDKNGLAWARSLRYVRLTRPIDVLLEGKASERFTARGKDAQDPETKRSQGKSADLAAEAKERQRSHGDTAPGRPKTLVPERSQVIAGKAAEIAADKFGIAATA